MHKLKIYINNLFIFHRFLQYFFLRLETEKNYLKRADHVYILD